MASKYQQNPQNLISAAALDWQWGNFNWIGSSIWASVSLALSDHLPISRWHFFCLRKTQAGNFLANLHQMRESCRQESCAGGKDTSMYGRAKARCSRETSSSVPTRGVRERGEKHFGSFSSDWIRSDSIRLNLSSLCRVELLSQCNTITILTRSGTEELFICFIRAICCTRYPYTPYTRKANTNAEIYVGVVK